MDHPLIQCIKEQRSEIRFLCSDGVKNVEIYGVTFQYGDNCMSQREILRIGGKIQRREGDFFVCVRSGWSSIVTFIEVKVNSDQRIRNNLTIDTDKNASEMSITHETWCKNGLQPSRNHFIVTDCGKL
jgi:hypothetical protein